MTMRYEIAYEGGFRFVLASSAEEALARFRSEWSEQGDEPPACWIAASWSIQS